MVCLLRKFDVHDMRTGGIPRRGFLPEDFCALEMSSETGYVSVLIELSRPRVCHEDWQIARWMVRLETKLATAQ